MHVLVAPQCFYSELTYPRIQIKGFYVYLRTVSAMKNADNYPIEAIDVHPHFSVDNQGLKKIDHNIGVALVSKQEKKFQQF